MNRERKHDLLRLKVLLGLSVTALLLTAAAWQDTGSVRTPSSSEFFNTLSVQERVWLRDHPVIRVVQDQDWPPVEFADERGAPSGMAMDYLSLVQQRLNVKFEQVSNLKWQEAYARLKRWEIDMTTTVAVTPERTGFWAFTKPYMSIPIVIATLSDVAYIGDMRELAGKSVAVVSGYAVDAWIPRDFPQIRLVRVRTAREGLEKLQRSEVFAYIDNLLIIGYYQAKMKVTNIKITGQTPYVSAQCMAVRKDWAPMAGILEKALESISDKERSDIYRKWVPIRYERRFNYAPLWQTLAILAVILLVLVVWNRKLVGEITSREMAEAARRKAETSYRILFEQSPDGLVIINPATAEFLEFNETAHRQLGYSREEFSRLSIFDVEVLEAPEETRARIARIIREGRSEFETQHRARQGEIRDVHVMAQSTEISGRTVYYCVLRDITDRKQTEEALRQGFAKLETTRQTLLSVVEDQKLAREALEESESQLRSLNDSLEQRVEERTRELENARRVALSMMQDADLDRRKAEDVLKQLAESTSSLVMLWQAVESSPVLVVITDTEGNIEYVNAKFVEVTGYSSIEAIGKNPRILKSGSHTPEFYQHLWNTIKAGKTWRGELCNRKKSGELFWEAASISPVRGTDGNVRQFLAIKEDVTEMKRAAEELRRAKDAADAASLAKSAFLASMSHEIRTPLNAVLGYCQLVLRDESLSARSRDGLQIINRSGEHLLNLINDILEMSKIEAGQVGLEPAEFDMHAMLNDLEAMFRLRTTERGLDFRVTMAKDLPRYLIADEGKTRQVLVNLLSNAVKFTKQGYVGVSAAANRSETGQLWLAVEVEDTGSGIAPEEMGRLFHYFEQTQSGRATQSGTGLGLVISREYAHRMGGDISVASEPGKGSVFRFEVPIAPCEGKPTGEVPDGRRVAGLASGQTPLRVLVADDQPTNRDWLCALLKVVGFEVREVENGQEALEHWESWHPHLILMDMLMPVMDGYEATRRIRSAPGGGSTVIIALTASTFDERVPAIMNAGVDDLVCKPFKEGHLFERIATHLGVRYRYDEPEVVANTLSGEPLCLTGISLSGLPAELLDRMRQAILGCDMDGFTQLLPQVEEERPSVAASLRKLAGQYDYDALARIVSESQ